MVAENARKRAGLGQLGSRPKVRFEPFVSALVIPLLHCCAGALSGTSRACSRRRRGSCHCCSESRSETPALDRPGLVVPSVFTRRSSTGSGGSGRGPKVLSLGKSRLRRTAATSSLFKRGLRGLQRTAATGRGQLAVLTVGDLWATFWGQLSMKSPARTRSSVTEVTFGTLGTGSTDPMEQAVPPKVASMTAATCARGRAAVASCVDARAA